MKLVVLLAVVSIILVSGCAQTNNQIDVKQVCIDSCRQALVTGRDLSTGPCLLNPIQNRDWVCDVAHSPRQPMDNLPENQCSSYGSAANHFVEVTPSCEFIRSV